jgi:RNA polymerase sigma-70 factor (ECF subfamily)
MSEADDENSDELLYQRFRRGDFQAFEVLYGRYRGPMYRFLLSSCRVSADADDLFQDIWMNVVQARDRFQGGSFKAYLYRIARNRQIDRFRRNTLRPVTDPEHAPEVVDPAPHAGLRAEQEECGTRLLAEIGSLPRDQQDAFLLKEEAGCSLEQIAAIAGVGRETVKSRLRYAMKRLRQALEDCL